MFGFIKKIFVVAMPFYSCNELNVVPLEYVSINNQECEVRSEIINIDGNEP